jgi:hypothetical protein
MLNADAHIDTIHKLLVGAIEGADHGYDATDAELVDAMWGLAMVCWLGGRAELWEPFLAMMQRLTPQRLITLLGWQSYLWARASRDVKIIASAPAG